MKAPRMAELCAVNIAPVNELKVAFDRMGIDVWEKKSKGFTG